VRYLSCRLINRITAPELALIRSVVPEVVNDLPTDAFYPDGTDPDRSDPGRREEALQTWNAIRQFNTEIVAEDTLTGLERLGSAIDDAEEAYELIGARVVARLDSKSDDRHLPAMREGVALFRKLAELREGE